MHSGLARPATSMSFAISIPRDLVYFGPAWGLLSAICSSGQSEKRDGRPGGVPLAEARASARRSAASCSRSGGIGRVWRASPRAPQGEPLLRHPLERHLRPDPAAAAASRTALDAPILPMSPTTPPSTEYAMYTILSSAPKRCSRTGRRPSRRGASAATPPAPSRPVLSAAAHARPAAVGHANRARGRRCAPPRGRAKAAQHCALRLQVVANLMRRPVQQQQVDVRRAQRRGRSGHHGAQRSRRRRERTARPSCGEHCRAVDEVVDLGVRKYESRGNFSRTAPIDRTRRTPPTCRLRGGPFAAPSAPASRPRRGGGGRPVPTAIIDIARPC